MRPLCVATTPQESVRWILADSRVRADERQFHLSDAQSRPPPLRSRRFRGDGRVSRLVLMDVRSITAFTHPYDRWDRYQAYYREGLRRAARKEGHLLRIGADYACSPGASARETSSRPLRRASTGHNSRISARPRRRCGAGRAPAPDTFHALS